METGAGGGMFYYLSTRPKPVMQFRERRRLGLGLRFITYLEERKPDGRTDGRTDIGKWRLTQSGRLARVVPVQPLRADIFPLSIPFSPSMNFESGTKSYAVSLFSAPPWREYAAGRTGGPRRYVPAEFDFSSTIPTAIAVFFLFLSDLFIDGFNESRVPALFILPNFYVFVRFMQLLSNSRVLLEMTTPTERGFYTILSSILFFSSYFFFTPGAGSNTLDSPCT